MSSRKTGRGDGRRSGTLRQPARKSVAKLSPGARFADGAARSTRVARLDREAGRFADLLEHALEEGHVDVLAPAAVQRLMAAICRVYRAQIEAGQDYLPVAGRAALAPTDVMIACGALLRAADLGVFELGIWQSFTGR